MTRSTSMGFVLAITALVLVVTGCGGSDEEQTTTVTQDEAVVASETVPPLEGDDAGDPKGAKVSGSGVYLCSSIDLKGEIGNVSFDGFHDISVRGMSCTEGSDRILDTYRTWDGTATSDTIDGYACKVLYSDDAYATVRCAKGGDKAYRFALQRASRPGKPERAKEVIVACGAFSRYYDISARDLSCRAAQGIVDAGAATITKLESGASATVDGYRCSVLYVQAGESTVRCVDGRRAVRVSIAKKPQPIVPKRPPEDAKFVKVVHKPSGTTSQGLVNRIVEPCPPSGDWDAITAKGVTCDIVDQTLTAAGQALQKLAKDASLSQAPFTCKRVDTRPGQAPTVSCKEPSGISFRASLIPSATGAATGSATTTTTTTAAPDTTTTTTP